MQRLGDFGDADVEPVVLELAGRTNLVLAHHEANLRRSALNALHLVRVSYAALHRENLASWNRGARNLITFFDDVERLIHFGLGVVPHALRPPIYA